MKSINKLSFIEPLLVAAAIMVACNIYTLLPLYDPISSDLSISREEVVIAASIFTFFYALGLLIFGPLSDKWGKRTIIVYGLGVSAASTFLVSLSSGEWTLFLFRGIQGFTLASFAPVAFSYTYDLFKEKKRTMLLVYINTGFLAAGILGQLISDTISRQMNWQAVFLFFMIVYLVLFLMSFFIFPATAIEKEKSSSAVRIMAGLLKRRSLILSYGIVLTLLGSFAAFYDAVTRLSYIPHESLFQIRMMGLSGAVLSLFTGKLIGQMGEIKTLFLGIALGLFGMLLLLLAPVMILTLMVSSVLVVSSVSLMIPTIITFIANGSGIHRSKALSLYSFTLLAGASLAPLLIMPLGFHRSIIVILSFFALDLVLGVLLIRTQSKKKIHENTIVHP
ncbi:MFS transporter [Falsibacillus pallidus]|uniref:MFS transporter n=1 Tax=Falsibacillus pallidus TaxID=493781 RepID=UPI003D96BE4F